MRHRVSRLSSHDNTHTPIVLAIIIGLLIAIAHLAYHTLRQDSYPGDFVWALRTAYTLLHGIDPYGFTPDPEFVPYPLPVAFFGFPLLWMIGIGPLFLTGTVFGGISAGILSWTMLRAGEGRRLAAILLSGPFWVAIIIAQWSPLIVAAWFMPVLAPLLVLIKPQIAFPVAAARWPSRRGLVIAAGVLLLSLAIDMTWPLRFLHMIGPYQSTVPALTLPFGPLLLLAVFRWRDERARLFFLMVIMPQRTIYDFLPLWLVPRRLRDVIILSALSWLVVLAGLPTWPKMISQPDMRWAIHVLYIPALVMLFRAHRASQTASLAPAMAETANS